MKTPLIVLLCIAASLGLARADRGTDLWEKVKSQYATCRSFSCEGGTSTVSNMLGRPFKSEKKFTIRFQRPDLLRVVWLEPSMSSFTPVANSLYTENGRYYGNVRYLPSPQKFKTLEEAIGAYAGVSGGITYGIPPLLLGEKGYFGDDVCRLLGEMKARGRSCYKLEVSNKVSGSWLLAVDKTNYAIVWSRQTHVISAAEAKKIRAEVRRTWKAKSVRLPEFLNDSFTIETTTNYSSVTFNGKMSARDFVFRAADIN